MLSFHGGAILKCFKLSNLTICNRFLLGAQLTQRAHPFVYENYMHLFFFTQCFFLRALAYHCCHNFHNCGVKEQYLIENLQTVSPRQVFEPRNIDRIISLQACGLMTLHCSALRGSKESPSADPMHGYHNSPFDIIPSRNP